MPFGPRRPSVARPPARAPQCACGDSCSRLAHDGTTDTGTGRHGTTPNDTWNRNFVRDASNLTIRWPRGRGSSNLPSRTHPDLRSFVFDPRERGAGMAPLLTLAHEAQMSPISARSCRVVAL